MARPKGSGTAKKPTEKKPVEIPVEDINSDVVTLEDIKTEPIIKEEIDYKKLFEESKAEIEKLKTETKPISEAEIEAAKRFEVIKKEFQTVKDNAGKRRYDGWVIYDKVEIEIIKKQVGKSVEVSEGPEIKTLRYNGTCPIHQLEEINLQMLNTKQKLKIKYIQK